ncbi:MAG: DUF3108 domain-containing protein [Gammaproteobacteria bacterium]|nr:DUF3108 domain-containing protein [Gammaproteobacteria bacterium]
MNGCGQAGGTLLLSWLLLFATAEAGEAPAPQQLRSFSAEYSLSSDYLELGRVKVELRLDSTGGYRYSALTMPVGLTAVLRRDEISEVSSGRVQSNRIVPERYRYHHQGDDRLRLVELTFDWQQGRVTNSSSGSRWSMGVPHGTQDKFSQRLALMLAVAEGRQSVELPVADGGRTKTYHFQLLGEEMVDVEAGRYQTLKLERSKDDRPSSVSLWLAPSLHYLPVMVKKRERDGLYWMQLRSVEWLDGEG